MADYENRGGSSHKLYGRATRNEKRRMDGMCTNELPVGSAHVNVCDQRCCGQNIQVPSAHLVDLIAKHILEGSKEHRIKAMMNAQLFGTAFKNLP